MTGRWWLQETKTIKIEILKQEQRTVTLAGGSFDVEHVLIKFDFGSQYLLSAMAVNGKWLHYDIRGINELKPSDVERYWGDRLLFNEKVTQLKPKG